MWTLTPKFDHVEVFIEKLSNIFTLKIKELQDPLETHELIIMDNNQVLESIQALQNQPFKNNEWNGTFMQMNIQKGSWPNQNKNKHEERPESSKRGDMSSNKKIQRIILF